MHIIEFTSQSAGIYIHIPFCMQKCSYCDFYSLPDNPILREKFIDILLLEIEFWSFAFNGNNFQLYFPADTLYFGGGTPSLLAPDQIERILKALRDAKLLKADANIEITFEINPETVNFSYLSNLRSLGIHKISVGLQCMSDRGLLQLGRLGSARQNRQVLGWLQKLAFPCVSADLLFGRPDQTFQELREDFRTVLEQGVSHISCYQLTLGKSHELFHTLPSNDALADMYEKIDNFFSEQNWLHYEISNYAKTEDLISQHNMKYWTGVPYLGLGPAAHSYLPPYRFFLQENVAHYLRTDFQREAFHEIYITENPSVGEQIIDYFLGVLRIRRGFCEYDNTYNLFKNLLRQIDRMASWDKQLQHWIQMGWLLYREGCFRVTFSGMLQSDTMLVIVAEKFLDNATGKRS